jgi:hypothetical protein
VGSWINYSELAVERGVADVYLGISLQKFCKALGMGKRRQKRKQG